MFKAIFLSLAVYSVSAVASPLVSANCNNKSQRALYTSDFHWGYELNDLLKRFSEIYVLPVRLGRHAYVDNSGHIKLPYDLERGGDVTVPESFVASIRSHIENALRLEYIDAVFFPDMGHSHFLVPQKKYDEHYSKFQGPEFNRLYEEYMADPDLKILYHTAEQLNMLDGNKKLRPERRIQERFYTRNLVGDNHGGQTLELVQNRTHAMNSASEVPGYYWWGAGFNVSANKDGCFAYKDRGVERYLDISLYDLEMNPNQDDGGM